MKDRAVADMAVFLDHRVGMGKTMHDAAVLQIGAAFQDQTAEIPAQRGARPDIATGPDDDIADQDSGWMDKGFVVNHRNDAVDGIDIGHDLPRGSVGCPVCGRRVAEGTGKMRWG